MDEMILLKNMATGIEWMELNDLKLSSMCTYP